MTRKKKSGEAGAEAASGEAAAEAAPAPAAAPAKAAPAKAQAKAQAPAASKAGGAGAGTAGGAPKAKAKAEPKTAEAKAKATAAPKSAEAAAPPAAAGKAAGKAKAKAEPKGGAEAPAKAKAKAKAEGKAKEAPKAEAKATAQPAAATAAPGAASKAKSKAAPAKAKMTLAQPAAAPAAEAPQPKGKAKAKAKAQAPAPEPVVVAPVVEEAVPEASMEVVRKKRRSGRKKAVEEEEPEEVVPTGPTQEELAHSDRIKSEHDEKNNALSQKFREQLKHLPNLSATPDDEVMKEVAEQRKALQLIMKEIDETLKSVKISRPKNMNTCDMMVNIRELKLGSDDGVLKETTKQQMLADMEAALSKALAFTSFRMFQTEMQQIKEQCQERLDANDKIANSVKSGNAQRKIIGRVAVAKGVKAEELNAEKVVSLSVDLPPEVTMVSFLYVRKFEKQYGVVIDRPEGAKGAGKGGSASQPPPKSLLVRGVEAEATQCVNALKGLDLSDRKAVPVSPKQAAAVMGPQQTNARQLEEKYKGVFVHCERNRSPVTLYGPAKVVAACLKEVEQIIATVEEHAAAPPPIIMQMNKDQARALIGARGAVINKMQEDTNCIIKVDGLQSKDDDAKATVKITARDNTKANQDKARSAVDAFLGTLQLCLVEAEPEVVTRLYDGAVRRGGKGKGGVKGGKGGGKGGKDGAKDGAENGNAAAEEGGGKGGNGDSFAELREFSGLTVVKKANGVMLIGPKADVSRWKGVLEDCMREAGTMPLTLKLSAEQGRLWNQERVDTVKASSGAKVQKIQRKGEASLEIVGTDAEKEKAKAAIDEVHERLGSTEVITEVPERALRSFTARATGHVHEVEKKFDVTIIVDWKAQELKILGAASATSEARRQVQDFVKSAATAAQKELEIEWSQGSAVIGRGGTTVNRIKQSTGIESLDVTQDEEAKKKMVVLKGSAEAVEAAEQMVKEVLQQARRPAKASGDREERPIGAAGSGATAEASAPAQSSRASEKQGGASGSGGSSGSRKGGSKGAPAAEAGGTSRPSSKKAEIGIESQESFPTLGSSGDGKGNKKGRGGPKNSAWKTADPVEAEGGEEAEEKEAAAAEEPGAAEEKGAEDGADAEAPEQEEKAADEESAKKDEAEEAS